MTNKTNVFVDIDEAFFLKNERKMSEEAKKEYGAKDGEFRRIYAVSKGQSDALNVNIEEIDAESNTITVSAETELGSFWITAEMNIDQLIQLIEVATKKLNKAKTLLETIK